MTKIAVLGAGSWGTALAMVLADNGHEVRLWTHNKEQAADINATNQNRRYLPEVTLPKDLIAYDDMKKAVEDVTAIVLVVPSKATREICEKLNKVVSKPVIFIHGAKGIEPDTFYRVSVIMEKTLDKHISNGIVALSGPSHAEEVSKRHPTTVTVSSNVIEHAEHAQDLFINKNFRVYTSPDLIGVELGGALKNIIALGAGISDGLGYGDNAKAALITRGLAEITRLGARMGANPLTFIGLTGVGDLIVTCTSVHSRNWKAGHMLGQGAKLDDVLESMGMVVEGVRTTKAAFQLAILQKVEMPITAGLYDILFENKDPKEVVDQLMSRVRRHEMEDLSSIMEDIYKG